MADKKSLPELTIPELKKELRKLNLSTTGNKEELLVRILAHDPDIVVRGTHGNTEAACMTDTASARDNDNLPINDDAVRSIPQEGIPNINSSSELELIRRERLLLQREIDLMRQENELLRATSPLAQEAERSRKPPMNIKIISELLSEYSGVDQDFARWEAQLQLLKNTYELNDNLVKVLIGLRLKGKALTWFHSKPELLGMTALEIIRELKAMYDHRPNKIDLRKQFEARTWQPGETFHDYYHDKIIKANRVPIPEDEILDYVIDGISDVHLRNHARMQSFTSAADMLQAFKKITVRQVLRDDQR